MTLSEKYARIAETVNTMDLREAAMLSDDDFEGIEMMLAHWARLLGEMREQREMADAA